ncbi:MAG: M14 family zinc carboxypeptidase, partial [Actinomycetota bacterium]
GNVCATQFVQWEEALDGLDFLDSKFGRYMEIVNLHDEFLGDPGFEELTLESAGLPNSTLGRDRRPLIAVKVTDEQSTVAENERKHFAYVLSIHGIERAGIEGGLRAAEDILTWAACEENPQPTGVPACATEGPFPKRILEPLFEQDPNARPNPTAGEVVRNSVVYFILSNPDGWHRGEFSTGGVFFQRYNGNGMDLNRDWPTKGYVQPDYTPWSEPETVGFGRYLEHIRDQTDDGRFDGGIDLHGQLTAPSFSFTLLGAGQRDYRKNVRTVETAISTFRDSEARLDWSDLIAPAGECPGPENVPMCSDQWGTVWDTINYQVTGSFGDWMDSDLGLNAVGIDNEMSLSHVAPNQAFIPENEQLHIDGNKGLIYSQIAYLLEEQPVTFDPKGDVGYVFDPRRITNAGIPDHPPSALPTQTPNPIVGTDTLATPFAWEVEGEADSVHNGGMYVEATCTNADAISGCQGAGIATIQFAVQ